MNILSFIRKLQDLVWGVPLMALLLGTGIYLMILLRGIPLRKLGWALSEALGGDPGKKEKKGEGGEEISAFSCLATELAATIGTGNIVGVVGAISLGGPGALWWMALSGVIGLATKLVESSLSVKYRILTKEGAFLGGPMVTLSNAFPLPRFGKALGILYASLAVLCAFGMGNMVQANSIAVSLKASFSVPFATSGWIIALFVLFSVLGGVKQISKIASFLVPAMGGIYLAGCLGILLKSWDQLLPVLFASLKAAFLPRAVGGGIFGTVTCTLADSIRWGVSRGIFSNEAGLGAGGISAAATSEESYVRQGFISMTGVFFDTLVICMVTGITYCCSGVMQGIRDGYYVMPNGMRIAETDGAGLMIAAFEGAYGRFGVSLLGICITLFAFATILGWGYQGEQAFRFLFGEKHVKWFRLSYGLASLAGAYFTAEVIWGAADVCNGLLALPNLICVLVMAPGICEEIRHNFARIPTSY